MQEQTTKFSSYFEVAPNVWGMKDIFVNIYLIKSQETDEWFLVDAGLKTAFPKIKKAASVLFGDKKPKAVILTHGHFDHVGALKELIDEWKVPIYAHYLELPYLTNKSSYPPADSTVGGGLMAYAAAFYPTSPIDLGAHIVALPEDGLIPEFKEWKYIDTPGHTFGHISLFRDNDKVLIAGDAFITTKGESAINSIFLQTKKISPPPAYFTPDWKATNDSIKKIVKLTPEVVATGHGKPMKGKKMQQQLQYLHENFYKEFVPHHGRYAYEPAIADAGGVLYVPPVEYNPYKTWFIVSAAAIIASITVTVLLKKKRRIFQ